MDSNTVLWVLLAGAVALLTPGVVMGLLERKSKREWERERAAKLVANQKEHVSFALDAESQA